MSEECPELLPRRYWVDAGIQFLRKRRRDLEKLGFEEERSRFLYKTWELDDVFRVVRIAKMILGGDGRFVLIRVSTQPLCLSCNALLKFSSKRCENCGSFNIERGGWLNLSTKKIEFEKSHAPANGKK